MKRRLIAAALVLVFPFGMAACGSQSKAAACHEIDNAAASASEQAQKNGQTTSRDPKVLRDRMADLASTYKKASKKVKNKKVKKAYKAVLDDLDKYVDLLTNSSLSNSSDIETVRDDLTKHGEELNNLCGFKWDK